MSFADLHIHTNYSDGTFTPEEVLSFAQKCGLSCISITDHDTVEALPLFPESGLIEVLPGIELTAEIAVGAIEVHILGYLINYKEEWFQEELKKVRQARLARLGKMCDKLTELEMPVNLEELKSFAGHSCLGRLHLARLMVKKGFVGHTQVAFNKYIGDTGPAYVGGFRLNPKEAIELILKAGGIPVLAHPYSLTDQSLIYEFIKWGLKGLEVIYPEHSDAQVQKYKDLARENNLLITGGSDCHGKAKPEVKMGMVKLPYEFVQKLKDAKYE